MAKESYQPSCFGRFLRFQWQEWIGRALISTYQKKNTLLIFFSGFWTPTTPSSKPRPSLRFSWNSYFFYRPFQWLGMYHCKP